MTSKHKLLASTALLAATLMSGAAFAQQSQPAHGARHHQGRAVAHADADKDGALSKAEFVAAHEKRFIRMDANRDGKIDRSEFLRVRDKAERKEQRRETVFKNADTNQDGFVTKDEWMAVVDKRFAAHDRNTDGKLAKDDRRHAKRSQRPAPAAPTETPTNAE